ncbi:hypothetical protein ACWCXH_07360 [Kitasatospora sp. NPDC001660]
MTSARSLQTAAAPLRSAVLAACSGSGKPANTATGVPDSPTAG